jgi:hypothetical protein
MSFLRSFTDQPMGHERGGFGALECVMHRRTVKIRLSRPLGKHPWQDRDRWRLAGV